MPLKPRQPTPDLQLQTVGGGHWSLATQHPRQFTMVVVYRGLHCPVCRRYLSELNGVIERFEDKGVSVLVVSTDTLDRATEASRAWSLDRLNVAYGLSIETAREWGLYVSSGRGPTSSGVTEPALFAEPGVFLIRPDRTLYWANISTMPFGRPHFADILGAIDFVIQHDYPARGEA